jgi:hypothetical protein
MKVYILEEKGYCPRKNDYVSRSLVIVESFSRTGGEVQLGLSNLRLRLDKPQYKQADSGLSRSLDPARKICD